MFLVGFLVILLLEGSLFLLLFLLMFLFLLLFVLLLMLLWWLWSFLLLLLLLVTLLNDGRCGLLLTVIVENFVAFVLALTLFLLFRLFEVADYLHVLAVPIFWCLQPLLLCFYARFELGLAVKLIQQLKFVFQVGQRVVRLADGSFRGQIFQLASKSLL